MGEVKTFIEYLANPKPALDNHLEEFVVELGVNLRPVEVYYALHDYFKRPDIPPKLSFVHDFDDMLDLNLSFFDPHSVYYSYNPLMHNTLPNPFIAKFLGNAVGITKLSIDDKSIDKVPMKHVVKFDKPDAMTTHLTFGTVKSSLDQVFAVNGGSSHSIARICLELDEANRRTASSNKTLSRFLGKQYTENELVRSLQSGDTTRVESEIKLEYSAVSSFRFGSDKITKAIAGIVPATNFKFTRYILPISTNSALYRLSYSSPAFDFSQTWQIGDDLFGSAEL